MMSADYSHGKVTKANVDTKKETYERKYMLLCEVALGNIFEISNYDVIESAPDGYDSVKALSLYEPNEQYTLQLPTGTKVPLGNIIDSHLNESNLTKKARSYNKFNQYVVYDESQICIRYIIQFRQSV